MGCPFDRRLYFFSCYFLKLYLRVLGTHCLVSVWRKNTFRDVEWVLFDYHFILLFGRIVWVRGDVFETRGLLFVLRLFYYIFLWGFALKLLRSLYVIGVCPIPCRSLDRFWVLAIELSFSHLAKAHLCVLLAELVEHPLHTIFLFLELPILSDNFVELLIIILNRVNSLLKELIFSK